MRKIFSFFALAAMMLGVNAQTIYKDATTGLNFVITGENTAKIVAGDYSAIDDLEFSTVKQGTTTYKVTEIGDGVFKNCTNLLVFTMEGDTPVTIGEEAFSGCTALEFLIIVNCPIIKKKAFVNCTQFEGDGLYKVTSIGDSAFVGCTKMNMLHWMLATNTKTLTSIGANAFEGCSMGNGWNIQLGSNQVSQLHIGENAFKGCTNVTAIYLGGSTNITYDGDKSPFDGIKEQVQTVSLNNSITSIPAKLFAGMSNAVFKTTDGTNLGVGVTMDNLETIGASAFAGCANLDNSAINHIFGSKLTTIGADAFSGCSAITSFTLPASLTTIGDRAFAGLSNLSTITANMTTPPAINANVFNGCGNLGMIKLKVSDANYNAYKAANVWKDFKIVRQSGLWTISFSGHDIDKATIQVLNAANDEVLDEEQITDGTTVKFVVTPAAGYINRQNPEPMVITGDEYITIDMYAITYRLRFIAEDRHGYFTFKKNGVDFEVTGYGIYEYGTVLSVTAHANEGYKFASWNNGSTNPTRTISFFSVISSPNSHYFSADFTYRDTYPDAIATFELAEYAITIESSEHGTVVASAENATMGTTITITATPDEGFEVDKYIVDGVEQDEPTFVMPAKDVTVSASFKEKTKTILHNTEYTAQPIKRIVNGQLLIEREGKTYNALGAEVK